MSTNQPQDTRPCAANGPFNEPCGCDEAAHVGISHPYVPAVDPREELIARIKAKLVKVQNVTSRRLPKSEVSNERLRGLEEIHDLISQYEKGAGS